MSRAPEWKGRGPRPALFAFAAAAAIAAVAGVLRIAGAGTAEEVLLLALALAAALQQAVSMVRALLAGRLGLDVLALAAIVATVAVHEFWASTIIVLMLTGGRRSRPSPPRAPGRASAPSSGTRPGWRTASFRTAPSWTRPPRTWSSRTASSCGRGRPSRSTCS